MKKILVIDENETMRENTSEILELSNYVVLSARNCEIGVEIANGDAPALIVCNLTGLGSIALSALKKIKWNKNISEPEFIYLTDNPDAPGLSGSANFGEGTYLRMPFEGNELLQAVSGCFNKIEKKL